MDDILITGDKTVSIHALIHDLNKTCALETLGSVNYFFGFEVLRTPCGLHLCQTKYASDLLSKTIMSNAKLISTLMNSAHKIFLNNRPPFAQPSLYRSTIGALRYLTHTRLDISYVVNKLSQFLHAPTTSHWVACKRLL